MSWLADSVICFVSFLFRNHLPICDTDFFQLGSETVGGEQRVKNCSCLQGCPEWLKLEGRAWDVWDLSHSHVLRRNPPPLCPATACQGISAVLWFGRGWCQPLQCTSLSVITHIGTLHISCKAGLMDEVGFSSCRSPVCDDR